MVVRGCHVSMPSSSGISTVVTSIKTVSLLRPIFSGNPCRSTLPPAYRQSRIDKDTSEQVIFRPATIIFAYTFVYSRTNSGITCREHRVRRSHFCNHEHLKFSPTVDGPRARHQRDEHPAGPESRRRRVPTRNRLEAPQRWCRRARVAVEQVANNKCQHRNRLPGPHAPRARKTRRLEFGDRLQGRPAQ